ncbi:MAG: hypothetical protein B6D34_09705 [Candidatus Brocadia sp. UTAMX1]|nr:MAG: hypothetical protein B6D34_09705 [Candidatus Brocadia sp. UTAMX1]
MQTISLMMSNVIIIMSCKFMQPRPIITRKDQKIYNAQLAHKGFNLYTIVYIIKDRCFLSEEMK